MIMVIYNYENDEVDDDGDVNDDGSSVIFTDA